MIKQQETLDSVRRDNFKEVVAEVERLIPDYRSGSIDFQELYDLSEGYRRGVVKGVHSRNGDLRRDEEVFPAIDMAFYKTVRDFDFSRGCSFATLFRAKVRGEISCFRSIRDGTIRAVGKGNSKKYKNTESLDSTNRDGKKRLEEMFIEDSFIGDVDDSYDVETYLPAFFEGLSQRDKLIVYLRYGRGLSLSQIGERVGKHKTNVGNRLTSFINPSLSERIERFEIPNRPKLINRLVRRYYEENNGLVDDGGCLTDLSLESLVHYCQFGNNGAFQALYDSLASELNRTVEIQRRKFPKRIHLMDIETGTLEGLRYAVEHFDGESSNFKKHLNEMVWKKTRSWVKKMYPLKRKKLTFRTEEEEGHYWERVESRGGDAIKDIEDREHIDVRIGGVMSGFDFRDSEIIYLKYGLGMQNVDIIQKMKMQETTFYRRLIRIKPIIGGRIKRLEIPYNPEIFMSAVRDYYQDKEFCIGEDVV